MAITTYEGLLETWADGMETVEQNLENLYGPSTIPPVLPSVTTEDGMLETAAEQTELAAWNFAKMYNYLSTETNTTRIVDVPDTALFYGQLAEIGGNTVVESGELLSAEVTSVISKKADGTVLQAYTIPEDIQETEGYGWSAESIYNYIDFERKVFVQNVASAVLDGGTTNITGAWGATSNGYACYTNKLPFSKTISGTFIQTVSNNFEKSTKVYSSMPVFSFLGSSGSVITFVLPDTITSVAEANAWFASNPTTIYYQLSTPVETDISSYITDTDIKVEAGGTITFDNSNDLDVPSEMRYMS